MNVHSLRIIESIRSVLGDEIIGLHEPMFFGNEWLYVKDCLDTNYVSSVGKYVDKFEEKLKSFTGAKYAVAVSSGTAALHVALLIAGVRPNDEVLIPGLTFIATANAVSYCSAIPHLIASDQTGLNIDIELLEKYLSEITDLRNDELFNCATGRRISAIVPMHIFGHPVDMHKIIQLAEKYRLIVIEDAAESIGSYIGNKHTGLFGSAGILSFNGNKTITTGGGGAIITNDINFATKAKFLTTTARENHAWDFKHLEIAYNYRMPNINAALGCAQLENLHLIIKMKRELHASYKCVFQDYSEAQVISESDGCTSNYWLQTLRLSEELSAIKEVLLHEINGAGISVRPPWGLINEQPPYFKVPNMEMADTKIAAMSLLNIPSSIKISTNK